MKDIDKFYASLLKDVETRQISNEDGETQEQSFTGIALEYLSDSGETENPTLAFDEKESGTRQKHKINGFSLTDDYDVLDVFITHYVPSESISNVLKAEIDKAATRITNFLKKTIENHYANDIAESSEIFEFARTLSDPEFKDLRDNLTRINVFILTNQEYKGEIPSPLDISSYRLYFKIVDINYLFQISEDSRAPIEIDFDELGYKIPCMSNIKENDIYNTYLAIIPGECLMNLYGNYGPRLMEQNVRTFLQFGGRKSVNNGLRSTIINSPDMFLAYNNGLATTVDNIELDETGRFIKRLSNLQIVNGGQTTAAIYHTAKGNRADVSKLYVQAKITLIKKKEEYNEIVSKISQFSNTQNKINGADFSSNNPCLLAIEKLSGLILTPIGDYSKIPSCWFFERVRGQYKNQLLKEGTTAARKRSFESRYPKNQVVKKEDIAKYVNSYMEVYEDDQLVIGPFTVVTGKEKNYAKFISFNLPSNVSDITNVYFEDLMAKAILFKKLERLYGTKNSERCIGELRQVVVPYSIGLLTLLTDNRLDLYKIWQNQKISDELSGFMYDLMIQVNEYILKHSPGSHYIEWAKKEVCWETIKKHKWKVNISSIEGDLLAEGKRMPKRKEMSLVDKEDTQSLEETELIRSIPASLWSAIANWGKDSGCLTLAQQSTAKDIVTKIKFGGPIHERERKSALEIYDIVKERNMDLILRAEEYEKEDNAKATKKGQLMYDNPNIITPEFIKKMVEWDKSHKVLEEWKWKVMNDVVKGEKPLTLKMKYGFLHNLTSLAEHGFEIED